MTAPKPTLTVIVGPTGSGKSDLAVELAQSLGAPIISTDSRQVYKGMEIGTAQPTAEQLRTVPHHFIADREPTERFSCADFEREAMELLGELFRTHPHVVAVGGSGLYIDALCGGLDPLPDVDPALREELSRRLADEGLESLIAQLAQLDPAYYATVDTKNPARVQRALEVCLQTCRPFSEQRTGTQAIRPFDIRKTGIDLPRPELYARIDARVDAMMAAGLEAEARALHHLRQLPALRTVGYSELFDHFDGLVTDAAGRPLAGDESLARAVELIKRNSRRYAKRQMTWFRRDPSIVWTNPKNRPWGST
ncbi:MAG: tRNA (adenosine(37)-N6)-dimethylallyltransferase MiaA [Alistipes sp.]|jgi:tRNA dimethylallyltransferase|nr:tRNA (adenosine(37)-N6)-dimethylallyltransferase MiaA [Alistipes sp.]